MTRRHRLLAPLFLLSLVAPIVAASSGCHISFHAEARDEITRSYPIQPGGTLEIRNTNGTIDVAPADGDTIEIVAERVARATTDEEAEAALEDIEIAETVADGRVVLDSTQRGMGFQIGRSIQVNYTVRLPDWVGVTLTSTNGAVEVTGLSGELRVETTNGRIRGHDLRNGAAVEATNGQVVLEFADLGAQGVTCETTNGAITLRLPRDANADLMARVTNGAIDTNDLELDVVDDSRRRLEASLGAGGTKVDLRTRNGRIVIEGR